MFNWKKCRHEWYLVLRMVDALFRVGGVCVGPSKKDTCHIYCPKCDTHRKVDGLTWIVLEKAQQVRKEYEAGVKIRETGR